MGEGPIRGNKLVAFPAPTTTKPGPLIWGGNVPVNPAEPGAPTVPAPVEEVRGVGVPCGPGLPEAGLGRADREGDGDLAAAGAVTATLAAALGAAEISSVGVLAVAVSVTVVPAAPAGTCACIW